MVVRPAEGQSPASKVLVVVGILGGLAILGVIALAIVGALSSTHSTPKSIPPIHVNVGQTINVPAAFRVEGIASATIYSFRYPVRADNPNITPDAGTVFGLADTQLCAGNHDVHYDEENLAPYPFSVVFSDGSDEGVLYDTVVKTPQVIDAAEHLKANQCTRGFMPFEFGANLTPVAIGYGFPDVNIYQWRLAPATGSP